MRGVTWLAAASLVSRLLGGLARVPLTRLLGGEGMGLFQMAYVVYGLAITFAVSGLCVATSRLVAEAVAQGRERDADRILHRSALIGLVTGAGLWLALDRGAVWLAAEVLGDERAAVVLRAIAPALPPVSVAAVLKGYFQGRQNMLPTSKAQVVEQAVRVGAMVGLVYWLRNEELARATGGAAAGNLIGAVAALGLLLSLCARRWPDRNRGGGRRARIRPGRTANSFSLRSQPAGSIARQVLEVALPVSLGAAILPVMEVALTFLAPRRLAVAGFDPATATEVYGQLLGLAYPLAGLPAILASAMAVALVPAITEASTRGAETEVRSRTSTALRLTVIFTLPATAGLFVLAGPINQMLFGLPEAGPPLAYVSAACLLTALQQTTTGVLQGLGLVRVPLYGLLGGLAAAITVTYFLAAVPWLGINGVALGIVAGFLVAAVVNLTVIATRVGLPLDLAGVVLRSTVATAVMAVTSTAVYGQAMAAGTGNSPATAAAVLAGAATYGLVLLLIGGVGAREIRFVPGLGPRLSVWLDRIGRG